MKRILMGLCTLTLLAADVGSVSAAWNNVFQTTLFHRRRTSNSNCCPQPATNCCPQPAPAVTYSAPAPCPQQCTTNYVQRCFYQPVTTYQTRSYYEPVTTYRTSYYYEPVCSYRYSCYYDPCTCQYQQVATPTTSYQLRAQSCPVQSWVQRCCTVPVTTYQKSCYLEPQTCCTPAQQPCCQPTAAAVVTPVPAAPAITTTPPPAAIQPQPTPPPPALQPMPTPPPPTIDSNGRGSGSPLFDRKYYYAPGTPGTSFQPGSVPPAARPAAPTPPPPAVKLERIVVGPDAQVEGQVVRSDNAPRANARLVFVNVGNQADRYAVTANSAGRFHVTLSVGRWNVYMENPDGSQAFHSRIDVADQPQGARITLVSR
jgi:hypothetical protein